MSVEIEAKDVIKVVLQFCKENGLQESFSVIQKECGVTLNIVDDVNAFLDDIKQGKWDKVLLQISGLKLPRKKVEALHEQIVLEMIELREIETARSLLHQSEALEQLRIDDEDRYLFLERACNRTIVDPKQLYGGSSRQKRRKAIMKLFQNEVKTVPPSRLMVLIGQAIKWQRQEGLIPTNATLDIFSGDIPATKDDEDIFPSEQDICINFGTKSYPECVVFLQDGSGFVTGSSDGFIEVWDMYTGALKADLSYQAAEKFMMHQSSILSLALSNDGSLLASGSKDGEIKVWRMSSGQCLRTFTAAHTQGVTSVSFSREKNKVLSSSFDGTIRIHGVKSGKLLKEYRGHESFVHSAAFSPAEDCILSASADSSVCVWDVSTGECKKRFRPPQPLGGIEKPTIGAFYLPSDPQHIVSYDSGNLIFLTTIDGELVRTFQVKDQTAGSLVTCRISNHGEYLICLTENGMLHCFEFRTGNLISSVNTGSKKASGFSLHPSRNILACHFQEGVLKLFKA